MASRLYGNGRFPLLLDGKVAWEVDDECVDRSSGLASNFAFNLI